MFIFFVFFVRFYIYILKKHDHSSQKKSSTAYFENNTLSGRAKEVYDSLREALKHAREEQQKSNINITFFFSAVNL